MTGTINPELPSGGEPRSTADGKIKGSLITLRDGINALLNSENKIPSASLAESKLTWYTPKVIATEESRTNTAFGTLTTADEIKSVVLPENGLLLIRFTALVKSSVEGNGRVALFLGTNQLKLPGVTVPVVSEVSTSGTNFSTIAPGPAGLVRLNGTSYVTTGMTLSDSGGGVCEVEAAAGTYNVSVQYKAASGSVTAKERKLYVEVHG
jgi:hypothetical protein